MTVDLTSVTSAEADWLARSTAAGVTFASDFSGASDFVLASTNGGHVYAGGMNPTTLGYVVKDLTDGLTNGCCLRIDTPAAVGANSAAWMFPLNSAWTTNAESFGAAEFYIQFRFKIPSSRLVLTNCGANQRGWKWLNLAQYSPTNTQSQSYSNSTAEHVLQDTAQRGLPQAYHRTIAGGFPPFQGFADGQITLQTAVDRGLPLTGGDRYCHYPNGTPGCYFFPTDEWMTFMVRIKIATYNGSTGNEFDLWFARKDATEWVQLFNDRNYEVGSPNSNGGGFTGINGGHLLNYETNRIDSTVDTWVKYDQVIVSTQPIALPAVRRMSTPSERVFQITVQSALSSLQAQASGLASGDWAQVSPTPAGLSLFTGQQGSGGLAIAYASKVARDPNGRALYFLGCDHGDETLFLKFDEASHAWTEAALSVPWGIEAGGTTAHGYDHTVFDDVRNKLYHRPYGQRSVRRWNGGTTWATVSYSGTLFYSSASAGVAWFPGLGANGRIVVYQLENGANGALISIDPVTEAVATHVSGSTATLSGTGDPHCFCLYSSARNLVYFGGGNGSRRVWTMNSSGTITRLDDFPAAITATIGPAGDPCSLPFINPSNGNLVVMQSASNWHECNPTLGAGVQWSAKAGTASILSANTVGSGAYGVACVDIPAYGVVAFIKNYSASQPAQMWLWKP